MAGKGSLSEPVRPHWFYCPPAGEKSPWLPLSYEDSHKLEEAYAWSQELGQEQEKDVVVPVEGSRYDVRLKARSRHAVYWSEPPSEVRRGLWFYKGSKESGYTPYPEDASHVLEEAYRSAVALNEWRKKVELPTGGTIFLQSPKLITQLPSTPAKDKQPAAPTEPTPPSAAPTPPTEPTPSRVVVRGLENVQIDIPEGEPDTVDHLVFMVHGIGPTCDLRMRTLVHCVNDFRSASLGLINSHFRETEGLSGIGRVEFLPITWHDVLHSDTGVDKDMERITLPSISVLRHFGNDTLLDVFFYNSPKYCQVIVDTVASDINRLHALFLQRHPGFTGAVSLAGHSLGSIILFDLLTNQKKSTEEEVVAEESDDSCQSDESVMASDESVTASDVSVTASDESVMASDESVTASDMSVTASDESVMASDEFVTASDWPESLEDILRGRGLEEHLHVLQREQVDSESLLLCTENDLKDLGIPLGPRKKILDLAKKFKRSRAGTSLSVPNGRVAQETAGPPPHGTRIPEGTTTTSSTISYHCSGVGTGQVSVNYPQLAFSPQAFFALGSPIGMFLTVRGLKRMAPDYSLPTCKSFYNIYHPYDPVAYRIEPLVLPAGVELPPVLLPHYKGRKRMHLELRDGLTRVSSEVLGSLRNVWQVFSQVPNSALPLLGQGSDAAFNTSSDTQDDGMSVATGTSQEAQRKDVKVGMLNGGRRFDYVLQEKPIEIFNQYLFAIQSHLCYWESEDTALLVLREIYEQQKAPGSHPTHAAGGDVVM